MPKSQQPPEGQRIMLTCILLDGPCGSVIDVGAGDGKWGKLLRSPTLHPGVKSPISRLVALEICPECVKRHRLGEIYDQVIVGNAAEYINWSGFDVVILGDVLEHLCREDGLGLIKRLKESDARVYLTVPISPCPQDGTVYGNPHETHLDQWTHEELDALEWKMLHRGLNPNGKVMIGTYVLDGEQAE